MNYKAIIEGQIETLQKVQTNSMNAHECCEVANTIISLCSWIANSEYWMERGRKGAK